jgi:hypothetical protein
MTPNQGGQVGIAYSICQKVAEADTRARKLVGLHGSIEAVEALAAPTGSSVGKRFRRL